MLASTSINIHVGLVDINAKTLVNCQAISTAQPDLLTWLLISMPTQLQPLDIQTMQTIQHRVQSI